MTCFAIHYDDIISVIVTLLALRWSTSSAPPVAVAVVVLLWSEVE